MSATLTLDHTLTRLEEITFLHRAITQVLAGWNPKIPDLRVKLGCALHAYEHMQQAARLEQHIWALTRTSTRSVLIPAAGREVLQAIDAQSHPAEAITGVYAFALPAVARLYREAVAALHPVCDYGAISLLRPSMGMLEEQQRWGDGVLRHTFGGAREVVLRALHARWAARATGAGMRRQEGLWAPLDRVPRATRPASLTRAIPGSLRLTPIDRWEDPAGIGLAMHNQLHGEYTTMELTSRNLYEHPEMPTKFHLDMARHAADEARHAMLFEELAAAYGVKVDDYPTYTLTYDGYYAYPEVCEPGSQRELLWRLLIRGTIDEGLALDDLLFQIKSREHLRQHDIASRLHYVLADETFHVQASLHWARQLCGGDEDSVVHERDAARQYVDAMLQWRRYEFEQAYPAAVEQELAHRQRLLAAAAQRPPLPFQPCMNIAHRKLAGYSERDLEQVLRWGYSQLPPEMQFTSAVREGA